MLPRCTTYGSQFPGGEAHAEMAGGGDVGKYIRVPRNIIEFSMQLTSTICEIVALVRSERPKTVSPDWTIYETQPGGGSPQVGRSRPSLISSIDKVGRGNGVMVGISKAGALLSDGVGEGKVGIGVGDEMTMLLCPTSALSRLGVGDTTTPPMIIGVGVGVGKKESTST